MNPSEPSVAVTEAHEADDSSTTAAATKVVQEVPPVSVKAPIVPIDNTTTKEVIARPKPRRRNTKFQEEPKPIGALGKADELGFQEARWALNGRVPYFQDNHIPNVWMKHTNEDQEWDDFKNLAILFPHWKLTNNKALGARQIPKCLFLDAQTPKEKLIVLNWWRGLTKDEQATILAHDQIHRYYRAPMRSNSPYKFCQRVSDNAAFDDSMGSNNNHNQVLQLNPSKNHQNPKKTQREQQLDQQASDHGRGAPLILTTKHQEPPTVLCFRAIRTAQQLVKRFQLSIGQLFCARVLEDKECCVDNCHYPALDQNRNCCFLHKQMWWPRTTVEHFQKRRGHLLLGMEYAVRPSKKDILTTSSIKVHPVPCGCSNPLCEGIGWSAETVRVPKGWNLPPSIVPNVHCDKDRPLRLAPWHFPPQYRLQLPDGSWKFALNKTADFPSPDYDLELFLKEPGMIEYQSRRSPWLLPDWVYAMQAVEQGPMTLAELQFRAVWNQRNQLMEGMAWQTIHHHELSQSHQQVNSKLEEMKKTHVHKRKLKKKKKQPTESPKKKSRAGTENYMDEDGMSDDEHQPNIIMGNTGNNTGNITHNNSGSNSNNNNRNHPSSLPPPRPLMESTGLFAAYREENMHEGAMTGIQYLQHHTASQQNQLQSPNPNLHHLTVNNHPHNNLLHQHLQQQQQQQQQQNHQEQHQQQSLLHQQAQQQQQHQLHTLHHSTSHLYHPTMPLLLQQAQQQQQQSTLPLSQTQGQQQLLQLSSLATHGSTTAGFFQPLGGDGTDIPGGTMGRLPNSSTGTNNMNNNNGNSNTNTNSNTNNPTTNTTTNNGTNPYQTDANRGRWGGFFPFR